MTKVDPAVRYNIHKIEQHLNQLVQFGVFDQETADELVYEACEAREIDYNDYLEGHWSRK